METTLSIIFHRLSATLYFIYCIWAVMAVINGIPTLIAANGQQWQVIFSIAVFIFAAPACFGATFWPSFARMELYAGAGFSSLIGLYIFFVVSSIIVGVGTSTLPGAVLLFSLLVLPVSRLVIVSKFLLEQAEARHALSAELSQGEK